MHLGYILSGSSLNDTAALMIDSCGAVCDVTVVYNDTSTHALPSYVSMVLASLGGPISMQSQPWPFSQGIQFDSSVFTTVLLMSIALSVAPVRPA
jgi:hypothetical protein